MPSNFRIPKARLDGAYGAVMTRVAQRMWGQVPDTAHVLWHNKPVLKAVFGFEKKVAKWSALDPHLKTYAEMASAGAIGWTAVPVAVSLTVFTMKSRSRLRPPL